ncbi:unnamed protein product [Closterium sp. NIES-64]|nr:unnamed protein product [Closterium sp. NIES-64]
MPPKRTTKAAVDVTLPDDLSTDPITTLSPDGDGAEKQGSDITINAPSATNIAAGIIKESATTAAAVVGGSRLTVEEKSQDNQAPTTVNDEFLEDDEDEELEIDIAKEDAFRLRYTAILLIPMLYLFQLLLTISVALAAASLRTSALITPILKDPSIALISTGSNREEWIYTQVCCGKSKGKTFLAAADHIISATHLLNQEKLGTATKASMDKTNLADLKKDYNF